MYYIVSSPGYNIVTYSFSNLITVALAVLKEEANKQSIAMSIRSIIIASRNLPTGLPIA